MNLFDFVRATEEAALAASAFVGRGDERSADQAAVDAMRKTLNTMDICARIVIGEGERDKAPMLYIGEEVGRGSGPEVDIALDPLEGTTLTAKALPNALSVLAVSAPGALLNAPDVYMEKIAIGDGFAPKLVSLDKTPEENVLALAEAKGVRTSEITACVLERPRHDKILHSLRKMGVRVVLISDGDVAAVIHAAQSESFLDIYMGIGGAPEGVLAAAALRCLGGQMQARLVFKNQQEEARARAMGITDLQRVYDVKDLAGTQELVFVASGVTDGSLVRGVRQEGEDVVVQSLAMNSRREKYFMTLRRPR